MWQTIKNYKALESAKNKVTIKCAIKKNGAGRSQCRMQQQQCPAAAKKHRQTKHGAENTDKQTRFHSVVIKGKEFRILSVN